MSWRLFGFLALGLLVTVAVARTGEPARCPCAGPTPEQSNLNPATFMGKYGLPACGFHIAKDDPAYQIESHHYCAAVKGGVFQCTIYDKDRGDAKLIGVEYVVSDELYQKLPAKEKAYSRRAWRPRGPRQRSVPEPRGGIACPSIASHSGSCWPRPWPCAPDRRGLVSSSAT
jgi:hypothetical protein